MLKNLKNGIKIKNLSYEQTGYIIFTVVIDGKKEIECAALHQDIEIGSGVPDNIHDIIWNFGNMLRKKVKENTENFLSKFEGSSIC